MTEAMHTAGFSEAELGLVDTFDRQSGVEEGRTDGDGEAEEMAAIVSASGPAAQVSVTIAAMAIW